jgi:hypothetical protein
VRLPFVFALALSAVAGAGCAAVAGLDQYSKCSGDCDAGVAEDVTVDHGQATGPEAAAESGPTRDAATSDAWPEAAPDSSVPVESGPDATPDAVPDATPDAHLESGTDASEAGSDAGCGATNTTSNCGACGQACMPVGAASATCNGLSCAYACSTGHSDCNSATAPDTDGCECATPGCCSGACQTTHTDGVGQSYYDCNSTGTFTEVTATEACTAFAASVGGTAADCSGGWTCSGSSTQYVCYGTKNATVCADYCWMYTGKQPDGGPGAGVVIDCNCPGNVVGSWN